MKIIPLAWILGVAAWAAPQPKPTLDCKSDTWSHNNQATFCEMREQTVAAGGMLDVDAGKNGGISVKGWDRADILVRTQLRTSAPSDDQAKDLARQVHIQAGAGQVRANGPASDEHHSWSVSYEVFVPTRMSAKLATVNGGVSLSDVSGNLEFQTTNGGLSLHRVNGFVHGRTTNGGVSVELAGDRWEGQGLDVATRNGGVTIRVPQNYSAQLEAQTTNGGVHVDGVPPQAHRSNHISTALGSGGALLKVVTTNGGVSLKRI